MLKNLPATIAERTNNQRFRNIACRHGARIEGPEECPREESAHRRGHEGKRRTASAIKDGRCRERRSGWVAAISAYKAKHTPEETEKAVRIWYERYDEMLAAAIQENLDLKTLRDENLNNGYELCQQSQDYEHCPSRRMAEARGARHDQAEMAQNSNLMVRIQHSFSKVRIGLQQNNLHYEWFKIRTTNNIDQF